MNWPKRALPYLAAAAGVAGGAVLFRVRRRIPIDGRDGRGVTTIPANPEAVSLGYETTDISPRVVARILAGLTGTAVAAIAVMIVLIQFWHRHDAAGEAGLTRQQTAELPFPAPRLQNDPYQDLRAQQAAEGARLDGYAWADPAHRTARIPIGRAMALVAGRSLEPSP